MFAPAGHISSAPKKRTCAGWLPGVIGLALIAQTSIPAYANENTPTTPDPTPSPIADLKQCNPKDYLLNLLPSDVSDGLDINGWFWFSYLHASQEKSDFTDTLFSLDITKSFQQRLALSFEGNVMNVDGQWRGEVEQLYLSLMVCPESQTLLTIGKFNANFGLEARDFWNRTHGTTSLLFAAQPQDLVGFMITQPLGDTGLKLRPFMSLDFQGQFEYNQSPSTGIQAEYKPTRNLRMSLTAWVGPGFVMEAGRSLRHPFPQGGYEEGSAKAIENWQGPNLIAERGGTLYFTDANVSWHATDELVVGAEFLAGTSGTSAGRWGWCGAMLTADFHVTDKLNLFARGSYVDDSAWLIYGERQRLFEGSGGAGYQVTKNIEIRGEYRHDYGTNTGSADSLSIHVTLGF